MKKHKIYLKTAPFCFFLLSLILCSPPSFAQEKAMPWIQLLLLSDELDDGVFSTACSPGFDGIDEAAPFNEELTVHPIVLLSEGKKHTWNESLPPAWVPKAVSDTELLACIGEEYSELIETCEYSPTGLPPPTAFFYRYGYYAEVTLLTAGTGNLIDTITISGAPPGDCPNTLTSTQTVYGAHVSSEDASNALSDYVNGFIVRGFVAPSDDIRDLAFDGTYLWLNDFTSKKLYKLDLISGEVLTSFDFLTSPRALAADGTYLWVACWPDLYKVSPTTGGILSSSEIYPMQYCGLEYDGTYLWGTKLYGDIYKLDPSTGEVLDSFEAPAGSWPEDLAFDGTHFWLADQLSHKIYKLDPSTGEVLSSFDSPARWPKGLAFDGTHLWVTVSRPSLPDFIYKINRR